MKTKICTICKKEKELLEFSKDKYKKSGYTSACKKCRRKQHKNWINKNPDKYSTSLENYKKENYEKVLKAVRKHRIKKQYGLTIEDFDKMYKKQQGCCAICGIHQLELSRRLDIDHNHITDKNRGLLCPSCNLAIGLLKVDEKGIDLLIKAVDYLYEYDFISKPKIS